MTNTDLTLTGGRKPLSEIMRRWAIGTSARRSSSSTNTAFHTSRSAACGITDQAMCLLRWIGPPLSYRRRRLPEMRPRPSAGAGRPGTRISLGGGKSSPRIRPPAPAVQRLRESPRLHRCDEQVTTFCIVELIDHSGGDVTAILVAGGGQ